MDATFYENTFHILMESLFLESNVIPCLFLDFPRPKIHTMNKFHKILSTYVHEGFILLVYISWKYIIKSNSYDFGN